MRASGRAYTIVRPGWFDANDADQLNLVMLQGDRRWAGSPADGVVSRRQIAQVLITSLTSAAGDRKTLELVAEHGPAPINLDPLFAALQADPVDALDAVLDTDNMPPAAEPNRVRAELDAVRARRG
ncbi:NAD-dependent epimerase/dehydratase (fragment) [Modestobacter italicus]|uniref:NAD-dependent epimerase/dehydratase n=1 Tax=Modestobacter italicus (strain DSM 44449 / CECT 9708 / BC 501) TaxID=2732864 RepID=I4EYS6_MODI5